MLSLLHERGNSSGPLLSPGRVVMPLIIASTSGVVSSPILAWLTAVCPASFLLS
jgi:hypothetical protein